MSFDISCDLSDFSHYCYHSHKSNHSIYVQVVVDGRCVLKKWERIRVVKADFLKAVRKAVPKR